MTKNNMPRIEVKNIGKKYSYGKIYRKSVKEILGGKKYHKEHGEKHLMDSDFWALKDVSFTLHNGETLGVIGPNGAGKSTLLKILSRIVDPTAGSAILRGRITSLLEVGTGFHPELTGRENVYFNGALLGMSKVEINSKFKEIEDFAELGHFIDMPVKYYSSGMRVRLGFSVASHLEAETMIIDEALSVGDARFKKKSLEKMQSAAMSGRTVIFVSHQMSHVEELCERSIYLDHGKVVIEDETSKVIDKYLDTVKESIGTNWAAGTEQMERNNYVLPVSMQLLVDGKEAERKSMSRESEIQIKLGFEVVDPKARLLVGFSLFDDNDKRLFRSVHADTPHDPPKLKKGHNEIVATLPVDILRNGYYYLAFDSSIEGKEWLIHPNKTKVRVGFNIAGGRQLPEEGRSGMIKPVLDWKETD